MILEQQLNSLADVAEKGKRVLRMAVFSTALGLAVGGCESEPSPCCKELECTPSGGDPCFSRSYCTNSPVYDEVDNCVTDEKGNEYCCGCVREYTPENASCPDRL